MGRTNIVLDDKLVKQAMAMAGVETKRELIDKLLREYVQVRNQKKILKLFGKGLIEPGYDPKAEYGGLPPRKRKAV